jgi:hypothetical protein
MVEYFEFFMDMEFEISYHFSEGSIGLTVQREGIVHAEILERVSRFVAGMISLTLIGGVSCDVYVKESTYLLHRRIYRVKPGGQNKAVCR